MFHFGKVSVMKGFLNNVVLTRQCGHGSVSMSSINSSCTIMGEDMSDGIGYGALASFSCQKNVSLWISRPVISRSQSNSSSSLSVYLLKRVPVTSRAVKFCNVFSRRSQ